MKVDNTRATAASSGSQGPGEWVAAWWKHCDGETEDCEWSERGKRVREHGGVLTSILL